MITLQKLWVRILISLFAGGLISEIIHISTGDPNRPTSEYNSVLLLVCALVFYLVLTYILRKTGKIK